MQLQYKIVPAFGDGYCIIAINNKSWKEVAGQYMSEQEAEADLYLFQHGEAVDNDQKTRQNQS